ncbi:hypothetical protein DsansV1_C22g0171001 [Dioscorea sansibarensis]
MPKSFERWYSSPLGLIFTPSFLQNNSHLFGVFTSLVFRKLKLALASHCNGGPHGSAYKEAAWTIS